MGEKVTNTLLLIIIAALTSLVIILLVKYKGKQIPKEGQGLLMLQNQLGQTTEQLNQRLGQMSDNLNTLTTQVHTTLQTTNKDIGVRLDNTANIMGDIKKTLGQLDEANKRIFEVGKDISSLQDLLKAPTFRGEIGEFLLANLLSQILPPGYFTIKHTFKNGEIIDAVIKIGDELVPVDSKFPLENFKKMIDADEDESKKIKKEFARNVKKHIDDISKKYILPDEGTYDFALMYIPAENVYYETIIKDKSVDEEKSICAYALSKKVIPVSPNSFYAYLQVILLGLNGLTIEKSAKEIIANLGTLQIDLKKFTDDFDVLGKHISNTKNKYEDAERRLIRFSDKLVDTTKIKVLKKTKEIDELTQ